MCQQYKIYDWQWDAPTLAKSAIGIIAAITYIVQGTYKVAAARQIVPTCRLKRIRCAISPATGWVDFHHRSGATALVLRACNADSANSDIRGLPPASSKRRQKVGTKRFSRRFVVTNVVSSSGRKVRETGGTIERASLGLSRARDNSLRCRR